MKEKRFERLKSGKIRPKTHFLDIEKETSNFEDLTKDPEERNILLNIELKLKDSLSEYKAKKYLELYRDKNSGFLKCEHEIIPIAKYKKDINERWMEFGKKIIEALELGDYELDEWGSGQNFASVIFYSFDGIYECIGDVPTTIFPVIDQNRQKVVGEFYLPTSDYEWYNKHYIGFKEFKEKRLNSKDTR